MDLIEQFLSQLSLNGASKNTIIQTKSTLERLNKFCPVEKCTLNDIMKFLEDLQKNNGNTMSSYKARIKRFFIWYGKKELVEWMVIKRDKKVLDEKTLFTQEEISKILETAKHPRDKCLIALISESAGRAHEILGLNVSDVRFTDYGADIRVPDKTKTGSREIPVIDSVQYIKAWLNIHPDPKPDSPFIVSFNRTNSCGRLSYRGALMQLKEIADKADIKKPGRWGFHLFRHTQLTDMARQGYNESLIRQKAGWTRNSRMVEIYIHPTKKDLVNATLAKHGLQIQQQSLGIQITKECPTCHKMIPIDAQFCENCSKHQDLSPLVKRLLEEHNQVLLAQEDFKRKIESLERSIENMNTFDTLANRSEQSWGFQTIDDAEAWDPGTGNVITFKKVNGKIIKSVRKPTEDDYKPSNPLLDAAPATPLSPKDQKRASEFMEKQKRLVDDLHARGGLTATEKARKLIQKPKKEEKEG